MSQWKKVRIGNFLTERTGRYKPDDSTIAQYQRLDKIDFSGTIHISNKPTKTDMILVQPGDLVISGINVAKGAVSVYQGTEPVCATIHYSAYTFNEKIVDLDFFKFFVKSPAFLEALKRQVKGGIKTEIKPKHLLSLEISIPDLSEQKRIVVTVSNSLKKTDSLQKEIDTQKEYAKHLRQNILQDAIEGKLTADWRKSHPVIKGNPDYDAEALFEKIQKEKASDKKQKQLPQITDEKKTFEIPEGWKWIHLNQIADIGTGATPLTSETKYYKDGTIPWITSSATSNDFIANSDTYITQFALNETNCSINPIGTLIVAMYGQGKTRGQISELRIEAATNQACATIQLYDTDDIFLRKYVKLVFKKMYDEIRSLAQGGAQPNLNLSKVSNTLFPLPPVKEQEEIVNKVESLLARVTELETQIQKQEKYTKKIMQSILKDAFEERQKE